MRVSGVESGAELASCREPFFQKSVVRKTPAGHTCASRPRASWTSVRRPSSLRVRPLASKAKLRGGVVLDTDCSRLLAPAAGGSMKPEAWTMPPMDWGTPVAGEVEGPGDVHGAGGPTGEPVRGVVAEGVVPPGQGLGDRGDAAGEVVAGHVEGGVAGAVALDPPVGVQRA
jgi:hypothetical protein